MRRHSPGVAAIALMIIGLAAGCPAEAQDQAPPSSTPPPATEPPAPQSPAPQALPGSPAPPAAPSGTPPATVLPKDETQGVLGKDVRSATGEPMGQIINVIVDKAGQPRAAVIDFGGFLGVGSRKIAVDWSALHFAPGKPPGAITLDFTRNQLKAAPEYKEGQPVVVLSASGSAQPIETPGSPEH